MSELMQVLIAVAGLNIALWGIFATIVLYAVNRIDADVKSLGGRMDSHATRIEQLYKMFVYLLKEMKK